MIRMGVLHILLFCCFIPYSTSITISPCATWSNKSIIISGNGKLSNGSDGLSGPSGLFYHQGTNAWYVADTGNNRVQMYSLTKLSTKGTTVVSNVSSPSKVYVDDDNKQVVIYVASQGSNRVEKWIKGAKSGVPIGKVCYLCSGVYLDSDKNVFMASPGSGYVGDGTGYVAKWNIQTDSNAIIAATLYSPKDIIIDQTTNLLYVAEAGKGDIRKWTTNSLNVGSYTAGMSIMTSGDAWLGSPYGLWIEPTTKALYIADYNAIDVQRWYGHDGSVVMSYNPYNPVLTSPVALTFDNDGNLYVIDNNTHVVKRFPLLTNNLCPSSVQDKPSNNYAVSLHSNPYFNGIILASVFWILKLNNIQL